MSIASLREVLRRRIRPAAVVTSIALVAGLVPSVTSPSSGQSLPLPPAAHGYWLVGSDGGVFTYGDASFHGSTGNLKLNQPVVGMASTPSGKGYWFVATDGGIFSFGDAAFQGSTGAIKLNKPIVGMASTPSGKGYWLVASDGGIFAFGDARFLGSTGAIKLNKPIVAMASTPTGDGYWLVASDGGLFSYGDATFHGAAASTGTTELIMSMVPTATGKGYWQIGADGTVFNFGDARRLGFPEKVNGRLVGAAGLPGTAGVPGPGGSTDTTVPGPGGSTTTTAPGTGGLLTPAQKGKPNVLLILTDDLRNPDIADHPGVLTKTKSWLTSAGTNYVEGYATTPLCCPERATIWSGRLSHNHGVQDNDTGANMTDGAAPDIWDSIIPVYLRQAGYHTSLVGKFITNWHGRSELLDPIFDEYAALQGGYRDTNFKVKDPGATKASSVNTATMPTNDSTDFIKAKALQYLNSYEADPAKDAQPWFMQISPHAPHDETSEPLYTWPERYNDVPVPARKANPAFDVEGAGNPVAADSRLAKNDKLPQIGRKVWDSAFQELVDIEHEGQLKTLLAVDDMVDDVMKTLQANGELENTLVIFTSDNGYFVGERNVDSKGWPYQEGVKVPFWARWDGVIPAGAVDTRPVGGEDILPALLDAAQHAPPTMKYELDGRSFLPLQPRQAYKYLEFGPPAGPLPEGYEGHRGIPAWASISTPEYQYIEYYHNNCSASNAPDDCVLNGSIEFVEYYDLVNDPWQMENLLSPVADLTGKAKPDQARLDELHALVQAGRTCVGTTGPNACHG